jgi:hypothetical protein
MNELQLSEIGIIRQALRRAVKRREIELETEQACELLISKLQKLDEVFHFVDVDNRFFYRYEQ